MRTIVRFIGSRRTAVVIFAVLLALLVISAPLPNKFTRTPEELQKLAVERPGIYWLSEHFSTPVLARSPLFVAVSAGLFLSTLICTVTRLRGWMRLRRAEFEKDKAFSFETAVTAASLPEETSAGIAAALRSRGWECEAGSGTGSGSGTGMIAAQKGLALGFWGSVLFHIGMLLCFLAAPVTALTVFRGTLLLTDGIPVSLREGIVVADGKNALALPDVEVAIHDLKDEYAKGLYDLNFTGTLDIGGWRVPISVNNAVDYRGYQITMSQFGRSVGIAVEKDGGEVFDYYLNLRNPVNGDYFPLKDDLSLFVILFPEFYEEGGILRSRSRELKDPVVLVKFMREGRGLHKGLLLRPGETGEFEGYRVRLGGVRGWTDLIVVSEYGLPLIALGCLIGIPGFFLRFVSNERRLEFAVSASGAISEDGAGSSIVVRGYSRYYPAFLEREVNGMAEMFGKGGMR